MKNVAIGMDLGLPFAGVGYVNHYETPGVLQDADGKTTAPSAVLIEVGRSVVRDVSLNQAVTVQDLMRCVNPRVDDNTAQRFQELSAVEISAAILKVLKADTGLL